ncbi:MAG: exosortase/archaeosortase family protein [Myxococcota bacterium]
MSRTAPQPGGHRIEDAAVALLVGALFGWSPVTTAHRLPVSIAGGVAAALALFAYRRWARRHPIVGSAVSAQARPVAAATPAVDASRPDRVARSLAWLSLALALLVTLPTWTALLPWYLESVWRNGHGLFLPLMIGAVCLSIRARTGPLADRPAWLGLPVLGAGLSLVLLDVGVRTLHLAIFGWLAVAIGSVLALFGPRTLRAYAPAIALGVFFLPLPSGVGSSLALANASAMTTTGLLAAIGHPVYREGALLYLPDENYGISVRCSGFAALYAGAALAFALGAASGRWWRTLWMLVALWPLTVLANGLRLAVLIAFCQWRGVLASTTPLHGLSGIAAFLMVVGLVFLAAPSRARRDLLVLP